MVRQRKTLKHCLMYDSAFGVKKKTKKLLRKKNKAKIRSQIKSDKEIVTS